MSEEAVEKSESLLRIAQEYDETSDNGSNEINGRGSKTVALSNAGIDEWINSDSSPANRKTSMPDSGTTDENDAKKRKRGRRGGKKRGFDEQKKLQSGELDEQKKLQSGRFDEQKKLQSGGLKSGKQTGLRRKGNWWNRGNKKQQDARKTDLSNRFPEGILMKGGGYAGYQYSCTFCNCSLNSLSSIKSHVRGFRHRKNVKIRNREPKKKREANAAAKSELENSATVDIPLSSLPDGILLIENGSYIGYHCAICNCPLSYSSKIEDHVAGFRHRLIIEARSRLEEQKKTEGNAEKAAPESDPEKIKEEVKEIKATEAKDEENVGLPLGNTKDTTTKSSVPLKSSLEDNLATVSEPVVGLNYVTQKQNQGVEPSYECSLCNVISDVDDMKAHILGTRHRLMYMKITDPQKIAELMAKNLPKGERNKEIREYIRLAMEKHGKGTIVVETSDTATSKKELRAKNLPKVEEKKENIASDTDKHGKGTAPMETSNTSSSRKGATAMESSNTSSSRKGATAMETSNTSSSRKGATAMETSNTSSSRAFQRKGQQETADKSRKDVAAPGAVQHKRTNEEGKSSKRKRQRGNLDTKTQVSNRRDKSYGDSYSRVDQQSYYDYDRQSYASDKGRLPEPVPPSQNNEETASESPKLPEIDVTNEQEAGIVMNVINSLTERFLQYKLKYIPGPTREILEKSLKGKNLLHALSLITDDDNTDPTDKPSSLSKREKKVQADYQETVGDGNMMERTYQDVPIRKPIDQSQHNWVEDRSRDVMGHSQYDWNKVRDGKAVDPVRPPSSWDKTRDARPSNLMSLSEENWDLTRDGKNLTDQLPSSWNTTRNVSDRGTSSLQLKQDWSDILPSSRNTRNVSDRGTSSLQLKQDWNDILPSSRNTTRNVSDRGTSNLQLKQDWSDILPSSRNTTRNVPDRGTSSLQLKQDWSDIRGNAYGKDTMGQSKYDWSQAGSVTGVRNLGQPNWETAVEKSKNIMDPLKYDRNEARNLLASRDDRLFDHPQYGRSAVLEDNRKSSSSNQFLNWTEPRQSLHRGSTDSLAKTLYYSEKSENMHSPRSTAASFNQQDQKWGVDGAKTSHTQQFWNRMDQQITRDVSDRSFGGYSAMARDDKASVYGRGTSGSLTSQLLQSTTSSLPQRRSVSYHTNVNDSFDRYEKKLQAEKNRSLLTSVTSGNRSYATPSLTTRLHYLGPSTPSSFSRSSTSVQWK